MYLHVEQIPVEQIRPTNILPQTSYWGRVKKEQGFSTLSFQLSLSNDLLYSDVSSHKKYLEDLMVLIKPINDNYCFAYVPYGPKLEPDFENQGQFLEELSECVRSYLPKNCIFIRYDLMWQNQWSNDTDFFDEEENWLGPPEVRIQEMRINYKTENWNIKKSPSDFLPKNTFFIDLTKDEDTLLNDMRYNTRYNIRKSLRKGINVKEYGLDYLDIWYNLYCETALRHQMAIQEKSFFENILNLQDQEARGVKVKLLMADLDGIFLSSLFLVISKERAFYLYGASRSKQGDNMASYALQWEAMRIAKKEGCKEYDMFGCAPNLDKSHPLYGVHIFKKGFGGNLYHRMGCWDYPFNLSEYESYKLFETQS